MNYAPMFALVGGGALAAVTANGEFTAAAAQPCERLASLTLAHATITLAQAVGPGAFTLPTSGRRIAAASLPRQSLVRGPA